MIERLSREIRPRVHGSARALVVDCEPDPITARLAGAFADLTLVDATCPTSSRRSAGRQIALPSRHLSSMLRAQS